MWLGLEVGEFFVSEKSSSFATCRVSTVTNAVVQVQEAVQEEVGEEGEGEGEGEGVEEGLVQGLVQEACLWGQGEAELVGGDCFRTCRLMSSTCWRRDSTLSVCLPHVGPSTARLSLGCRALAIPPWHTIYQVSCEKCVSTIVLSIVSLCTHTSLLLVINV